VLEVAVLVISSKILSGKSLDTGREGLEKLLKAEDAKILNYQVVSDEREAIRSALLATIQTQHPDVIFTVGGTGVRPDVIDKEIPGIGEAMRVESLKKVRTAMLSRGTAGIKNSTLIVNLPGSAKGAQENLGVLIPILEHTVEKLSKNPPTSKE
jgi:molybdenum cofactor synthesis domain-containing protein